MAVDDHPRGTCGLFCPYCAEGVPRTREAVEEYMDRWSEAMSEACAEVGDLKWWEDEED